MSNKYKYIVDLEAGTDKFNKQTSGAASMLKGLGAAAVAAGAIKAFQKMGQYAMELAQAADIQMKAEAKVAQGIRATGGAAGYTAEELKKMASGLQDITLFGDEKILNDVTAQLLTFTNISGDSFARAQEAALNLSTVLDGDLKGASIQLGKALNDPIQGISALSRVGIQFSESQKKTIKALVETNKVAEAQALILDELDKQYGGQAAEAAKTGLGVWIQWQNRLGDIKEALGGYIVPYINKLGGLLSTTFSEKNIDKYRRKLIEVANWFINIYNESVVLRGYFQLLGANIKSVFTIAGGILKNFWDQLKNLGKFFKAVFTGNFKAIPGIIKDSFDKSISMVVETAGKVADNYVAGFENTLRGKIEYIDPDAAKKQAVDAGKSTGDAFIEAVKKPLAAASIEIPASYNIELPDDLFGPSSYAGQMNSLSASTAAIEAQFKKAEQSAILFGDAQSLAAEKASILQSEITNLIDEGFDANSVAIQGLMNQYDHLLEKQTTFMETNDLIYKSLMDTAAAGAESFDEMGRNMLNTMRDIVTGLIAQGVAAAISTALSGAPWPFNLIAAPAAAAVATTAFNTLIPAFADGGLVYGPTMGLMGEYSGAKSNPEVIAPLDKLKGMLRDTGGGFDGGKVEFKITGDVMTGVLVNYNKKQSKIR